MLNRFKLMALAESLGGVETLVCHPATMTHASVPPERRAAIGLTDSLIRISAGIEDIEDLKDDLDQALQRRSESVGSAGPAASVAPKPGGPDRPALRLLSRADASFDPLQVVVAAVDDRDDEELRHVVGMAAPQDFPERVDLAVVVLMSSCCSSSICGTPSTGIPNERREGCSRRRRDRADQVLRERRRVEVSGRVVIAITKSLIALFSLVRAENLIQPSAMSRRLHTVQEQRDRRRRLLTWGLSLGLAVLLVNAIVGENGYLATVRARNEFEASAGGSTGSATRTSGSSRRAAACEHDPAALEEAARDRLNLLKPGETLVIIKTSPRPARRRFR